MKNYGHKHSSLHLTSHCYRTVVVVDTIELKMYMAETKQTREPSKYFFAQDIRWNGTMDARCPCTAVATILTMMLQCFYSALRRKKQKFLNFNSALAT